jgi:hypothetical protein
MTRSALPKQNDLRKRVLGIVRKQKVCDLDELILECKAYSWTDVFLEVDQLSRGGELRLSCKKAGEYSVTILKAA